MPLLFVSQKRKKLHNGTFCHLSRSLFSSEFLGPKKVFYGIPASPGVSHGQVFRFLHGSVEVPKYEVQEEDQDSEISRFEDALAQTKDQITKIRSEAAKNLGEKEAGIFDAHLMVLEDRAVIDDVVSETESQETT